MGDLSGAEAALAHAVPAVVDVGDRFGIPIALSILAGLAAQRSRPRTALRLAGAASAHEQADQTNRPQFIRTLLEAWLAPVLAEVGPASIRLQAEGRTMGISAKLIAASTHGPRTRGTSAPRPRPGGKHRRGQPPIVPGSS